MMNDRRLRAVLTDDRGIALPLSLIVLTLLTSLTLAFLAMSSSEPMIAANLKSGEQALALAEAGIERAIWALVNPAASGLTNLNQIPASYNGGALFTLGSGGYDIRIATAGAGCNPGPVCITSHGY